MREGKRSLTFFLMALFIIGSLPITSTVSADDEIDNWPENDAWLHIELISWSANETVEWDSNGGLPDPIFKICIEADGDNLDCINTPTWDNQLTLNNSWNYSIDIPDHTNILNITIECEDNDALNDDECDMNSELDEWKLYAEYNWSATPTLTVSGNGDGDGNETWKNAASTWKFTIDGFGDEDEDGVSDNVDECPSSNNPAPSDMDKSIEVDSTGCFVEVAGSGSDSELTAGLLGVMFILAVVIFGVRKVRSPKQEQVFYAQPQPVISPVQQQSVPIPQLSLRERELEHQSRQAQIEAQRLRQQLANQAQLTQQLQSEVAQKQMSDAALAQKKHEAAVAQQEKEELEAKLAEVERKLAEAEKNTSIVQNITYNIQDSAISGDITNKINRNDLE